MNDQHRQPAGSPTGGQFAASERAEAEVALDASATDPVAAFRDEAVALERRWREDPDTDGVFNGLIAGLARRVLATSPEDRPGYARLQAALGVLDESPTDDDVAEEVLFCLDDITATPPRSGDREPATGTALMATPVAAPAPSPKEGPALTDGWRALAEHHPHHTERIAVHNSALRPGAIAVLKPGPPTSSFYTGVKPGDRVVVTDRMSVGLGATVQRLHGQAAHLAVAPELLEPVEPGTWGMDEVTASRRAAKSAAQASMESALNKRTDNGYGLPPDDDGALAALDEAAEYRSFEFAVDVLGRNLSPW